MRFLKYDLGHAEARDVAVVDLAGNAANVMLLDMANFAAYRRGGRFRYHGGHFARSPAHITVPSSGQSSIVVDLGGAAGRVSAAVSVIRN